MNDVSKEIIILSACTNAINDMVNKRIFTILGENDCVNLLPETEIHQRLFNILLVEFLSGPHKEVLGLEPLPRDKKDCGYLYYIQSVYLNPKLNFGGQEKLKESVEDFISWLNEDCVVDGLWLPSINTELTLTIPRVSFLKICGDISKHGFIRLDQRIQELKFILEKNSVYITTDQTYLVLPEFYEWFHKDIFNYHLSNLAEFLNNINWCIYEYLDPIRKETSRPDKSLNLVAESMYYDLKNFKPYVNRFKVTKSLKMRY